MVLLARSAPWLLIRSPCSELLEGDHDFLFHVHRPGNHKSQGVSFESLNLPEVGLPAGTLLVHVAAARPELLMCVQHFLRQDQGRVKLEPWRADWVLEDALYGQESTFEIKAGDGYVTIHRLGEPAAQLRHKDGELWMEVTGDSSANEFKWKLQECADPGVCPSPPIEESTPSMEGGVDMEDGVDVGTSETNRGDGPWIFLIEAASAGDTLLQTNHLWGSVRTGALRVGDALMINPGGHNEEGCVIAAFGSITVETPLLHDHAIGEVLVLRGAGSVEAVVELLLTDAQEELKDDAGLKDVGGELMSVEDEGAWEDEAVLALLARFHEDPSKRTDLESRPRPTTTTVGFEAPRRVSPPRRVLVEHMIAAQKKFDDVMLGRDVPGMAITVQLGHEVKTDLQAMFRPPGGNDEQSSAAAERVRTAELILVAEQEVHDRAARLMEMHSVAMTLKRHAQSTEQRKKLRSRALQLMARLLRGPRTYLHNWRGNVFDSMQGMKGPEREILLASLLEDAEQINDKLKSQVDVARSQMLKKTHKHLCVPHYKDLIAWKSNCRESLQADNSKKATQMKFALFHAVCNTNAMLRNAVREWRYFLLHEKPVFSHQNTLDELHKNAHYAQNRQQQSDHSCHIAMQKLHSLQSKHTLLIQDYLMLEAQYCQLSSRAPGASTQLKLRENKLKSGTSLAPHRLARYLRGVILNAEQLVIHRLLIRWTARAKPQVRLLRHYPKPQSSLILERLRWLYARIPPGPGRLLYHIKEWTLNATSSMGVMARNNNRSKRMKQRAHLLISALDAAADANRTI